MAEIVYVYSDPTGLGNNNNPAQSLGGGPSIATIAGTALFKSVTGNQSAEGVIDYRCVYVVNDSSTEFLYNSVIYIPSQVANGATIELGFKQEQGLQNVYLSNFSSATGGSITLTYTDFEGHDFTVNYDSDADTFGNNFQNEIQQILGLEDVSVSTTYDPDTDVLGFIVEFTGGADNRNHQILAQKTNSLTYTGSKPELSFEVVIGGGPINTEADVIDVETTVPTSVAFSTVSFDVGVLKPYDVIPIWIKRIVAANTEGIENDGFTLRLRGDTTP